jgi:hypothetical protein
MYLCIYPSTSDTITGAVFIDTLDRERDRERDASNSVLVTSSADGTVNVWKPLSIGYIYVSMCLFIYVSIYVSIYISIYIYI